MTEQNLKNHARFVIPYHLFTGIALLALIIGSIRNLIYTTADNVYNASLLVLVSFILLSVYIYCRTFALRAQDRAIRAEENLRHYALTGKLLDRRLRMGQIIALRFASDEEFPALAQQAVEQSLDRTAVKRLIKTWRPDYYRV